MVGEITGLLIGLGFGQLIIGPLSVHAVARDSGVRNAGDRRVHRRETT